MIRRNYCMYDTTQTFVGVLSVSVQSSPARPVSQMFWMFSQTLPEDQLYLITPQARQSETLYPACMLPL